MSWSDYQHWIDRGRPFRLMEPAKDLRDCLRQYGYTVYDIGNESHLTHEPPEDHTPYSETSWPGSSVYGVGYAVDIMPPPAGSGLPSLQRLGAQLHADRRADVAGIRWLKYMNWEPERNNGGACYHDSWQPDYARRSSSDRGHIHVSGRTGYETSEIGSGYDPVARIRGDDVTEAELIAAIRKAVTTDTATREALSILPWAFKPANFGGEATAHAIVINGVADLSGKDWTDEGAIVAGILAQLSPEKIAAAIPATQAQAVADEIARRMSGTVATPR